MSRNAREAMLMAVAVAAVSISSALVVTQCSTSSTKEEKRPDVAILDYAEYAPMSNLMVIKNAYREVIPQEGYSYYDMPFEDGFIKYEGSQIPCKKHPVAYWKKDSKESLCQVTIYFDCQPQYLSHTSTCEIK